MTVTDLTEEFLQQWPLPQPASEGDKEDRGRVVVIAGSREVAGAAILTATATLRAGAGKLQIAVPHSTAIPIGIAVPEAKVIALPEDGDGEIAPEAERRLVGLVAQADALVLGPGMQNDKTVALLLSALLQHIKGVLILDAGALIHLDPAGVGSLQGRCVLTPHAGEMAAMLGTDKKNVLDEPLDHLLQAVQRYRCVVVAKGRHSLISGPSSPVYRNLCGNVGLAASGSGDVLAGIIAGLAARGGDPLQAAAWGVHLHAAAGDRLKERSGLLGYLPRHLAAEVPSLLG